MGGGWGGPFLKMEGGAKHCGNAPLDPTKMQTIQFHCDQFCYSPQEVTKARLGAVQYASSVFPFHHTPSRFVCMIACGDRYVICTNVMYDNIVSEPLHSHVNRDKIVATYVKVKVQRVLLPWQTQLFLHS